MSEFKIVEEKSLMADVKELVFKKQVDLVNTILSKEQEITELKAEEQRISNKRKYLESQLNNFKEEVKSVLEENGIEKLETEVGKISIRQNPISVEVVDIEKVPNEYKIVKTTVSVDKKKITDNFKTTGEVIDGIKLNLTNTSLQVK